MKIEIAPGLRLFVDIEGLGLAPDGATMRAKPTLVLLHGGPGADHSSFKPFFSEFIDVAQIVYVDHRGHGRSDPCQPSEWTLDTWADDIVRLCTALGIERPIVLGQSFGGFVAQRYLARHPAHPSKIILSSTSPHMGLERKVNAFGRLGGDMARQSAQEFWSQPCSGTWASYIEHCHHLYNTTPTADAAGNLRKLSNREILFTWAAGEQQTMDLLPGLAKAQCPVLVMAGEEDPVCPIDDARDIAAALPAEWRHWAAFPRCGHGVWRDDPSAAMACLRAFISA